MKFLRESLCRMGLHWWTLSYGIMVDEYIFTCKFCSATRKETP